jgi:hypothetical protein
MFAVASDRLGVEAEPDGGYTQSLPLAAQALHVELTPLLTPSQDIRRYTRQNSSATYTLLCSFGILRRLVKISELALPTKVEFGVETMPHELSSPQTWK